ncbi:MAG TPA: DUF748 domain-containing protein [Chryseosolibacter sp.]|nr:DUF748 domain-containing protein [Chryseosolibacter sp.]
MAKHRTKKYRLIRLALIVIVLLVAIRLALPYVILKYANKSLNEMDGYRGHVEDIDLAIIRGAYRLDSIYLNKLDSASGKETPFFAASIVDLSIEWKALLKGEIVGELIFTEPMLRFTKDKVEPDEVRKDSTGFKEMLDAFMPLRVNRFEANNARLQYIDEGSKPPVNIQLTNAYIIARNLRNSYDSAGEILPASLQARADVYEGTLNVDVRLNPLAEDPTFDLNAQLQNTNLVKMNDFFKAYAKADVSRGTFGLYTELAAKDGKFTGYVKPMIKDLDVLGHEDRKDNLLKKLWEGIVGGVGEVFENQPKERIATKVPLEGSTRDLDTNVWYAIGEIVQNAFIRALQPSIDQEINIATVDAGQDRKKNFIERIFGKKDDKKDKKERN